MSKGNEESSHNYSETYLDDGWKKCYVSKGCSQGYGYKVDDENPICIPLEQVNGVEDNKTKSATFCETQDCPFNPDHRYNIRSTPYGF